MQDAILRELQSAFLVEASRNLAEMESNFVALREANGNHSEAVTKLKAFVHEFKASAKAVGLDDLAACGQELDTLLALVELNGSPIAGEILEFIQSSRDLLKKSVDDLSQKQTLSPDNAEKKSQSSTDLATTAQVDETVPIPLKRIDALFESFGEQAIHMLALEHYKDNLERYRDELIQTIFSLKKITYDLQQSTMSLRMVSLKATFDRLGNEIQLLGSQLGKKIDLRVSGNNQELDKSIVDRIVDSLLPIVRSLVTNEVETDTERENSGKPLASTLHFSGFKEAGSFVFQFASDGRGLSSSEFELKTKDIKQVREVIQSLNGTYEIQSEPTKGTKIKIKLPVSLSLFNGLCFSNKGERYIIPSSQVIEIVNSGDVQFREINGLETVAQIRTEVVAVLDLRNVLIERKPAVSVENAKARDMLLISKIEGKKVAFRIEQITGIVRVVQKPLTPEMSNCPGSVGVTILGDGKPAIILDPRALAVRLLSKTRGAA